VQNFQYDGIPMSRDSAYSAGNTLSDTAIYDRIEVLKGATGLLTGMGDPGATINLVRKKPGKDFAGSARWVSAAGTTTVPNRCRWPADCRWTRARRAVSLGRQAFQPRPLPAHQQGRLRGAGSRLGERTLLTVGGDAMDSDPKGGDLGRHSAAGQCRQLQPHAALVPATASWSGWRQYVHRFCHAGAHVRQRLGVAAAQPPGQRL
jgi:outer membrane receptor for ferric coprogen and ferric-rhodotorulic acid